MGRSGYILGWLKRPGSVRVSRLLKMVLVMTAVFGPLRSGAGEADSLDAGNTLVPDSISRKLKLLESLTRSERTRARLEQSDNPDAQAHFTAAVAARESASAAIAAGEGERASAAIATGYREMALALRNAEDEAGKARQAAARYEELSGRVFSFAEAFQRIAHEKNDPRIVDLLDQDELNGLMRKAQLLAADGKHSEANESLQAAAMAVERALAAARDRETLVRELNFQTPAEEFDYELRRNESYELLVRLLEQREGSDTALGEMREVLEQNDITRYEAQEMFVAGEVSAAIAALERRSEEMASVLRRSGLVF